MLNFYLKASLWKLFQEGEQSETPEVCTSGGIHTGIFIQTLEGVLDGQRLNKTSNACQSTAGNWSPQTGSFPQSIDAQHPNFPSESNL